MKAKTRCVESNNVFFFNGSYNNFGGGKIDKVHSKTCSF